MTTFDNMGAREDGGPREGGAGLRPSSVSLRVPSLEESLGFYEEALGLRASRRASEGEGASRTPASAGLSPEVGGPVLIELEEAPDAPAAPRRAAGLFHLALRVPTRRDLARVLVGLQERGVRLQGASNHLVSEALYMADPHGNGVEIYADRPRASWEWRDGEIRMATEPLDVEDLLAELEGGGGRANEVEPPLLPSGTDLGHVHLRVTDLDRAEAFYSRVLGFDVTTRSYPGARFFGAGRYHHHVGANVWQTAHGGPRPEGALGLIEVRLATGGGMSGVSERARAMGFEAGTEEGEVGLRDGDGIRVRLEP